MSASIDNSSAVEADSDDDFDWEEVVVPHAGQPALAISAEDNEEGPSERPHIEITIQTQKRGKKDGSPKKNPRAEQLYAERLARLSCHQVHTVALLVNAKIRNKWLNDRLLHARLMSTTPLHLQNAFANITKSRVPGAVMRGRLFEAAITRLAEWWSQNFRVELTGHIKNRTWDEVHRTIAADPKGKGKARARDSDSDEEEDGEVVRSPKSLMKHALMMRGSRDTSAQLFTALCRALGIPARLVVSLQSVPWQAGVGKPKTPTVKKKDTSAKGKGKGKEKAIADDEDDEEDMDMEEIEIPAAPSTTTSTPGRSKVTDHGALSGAAQRLDGEPVAPASAVDKQKAPHTIKLRKTKGRKLGSVATVQPPRRARTPDPTTTPPVFWTEVFSKPDTRWLPVDPIRCIVNKRKAFDPTQNPTANTKPDRVRPTKVENRMVYVVAFEEDGFAKDVTPRYAREYSAKVAKMQQGGKGRKKWWERIIALVKRPYQLHRDDLEDEELQTNQLTEGMPTTMGGFKDHPIYVLERHLKRDEVIYPMIELGKFRGEPVYARSSVLSLKTAENWTRQGRRVREGAQPMKWVKQRAMTVNKQRAIEMALSEQRDKIESGEADGAGFASEDGVMQGLYAESQTELYRPDPVVNGKVPKNDFGNIDLYVPSMLPAGAVHIPYRGAAKNARQLGFDYAEAVTGFEFKKRRAFPVLTGIVIAAENEQAVLEAYWEAEHDAEEKRRAKRQEQVIKRWTKLIQGLRIRQRLQEQYADVEPRGSSPASANEEHVQQEGGFLTGADDVVQPYTLPRNMHELPQSPKTPSLATIEVEGGSNDGIMADDNDDLYGRASNDEHEDGDAEEVVPSSPLHGQTLMPKTMLEIAEAAAAQEQRLSAEANATQQSALVSAEVVPNQRRPRVSKTNVQAKLAIDTAPTRTKSQAGARRTKKRTREDVGSSDAMSEAENPPTYQTSRAKRAKKVAPSVPASTRVLRPRAPKSASMIQEAEEMEEAYRDATEE
ncbi:Rad4-domain-containing protein [Wolfiporia cocos MD-104 SS10]|uniref:Rad4-domain-containing protein n=1 Tax=Wolfiporia cocos (strain MD-104) TaxID=742152 RepID=A0A2H3JFD8_WOLCO|nr:Rad4-domain-containing protein [Wolfiporia cocos MD-104 SS10]